MSSADVKGYYDRNTAGFLRFGQGGDVGAIHRAVWGPGVADRRAAFRFVEDELLRELDALGAEEPWVLDLGCGVGASLSYLATRRPLRGRGVTISPVQAAMARERLAQSGLADRVACREADFTSLPDDLPKFQLVYAIEAFSLGPDPAAFFAQAAEAMAPGGRLVLCDDFATARSEGALTRREARWLDEFRTGWCAQSLIRVDRARELAERTGLVWDGDLDLTSYLELRRPRDRVITALVRVGRRLPVRHPWWMNLVGGNALQMALVHGLIEYRMLRWHKPG